MIDATTIAIGGNRVARVGTYTLQDGNEVELRIFIASGWASQPPLPFGPELVDVPASAVSELVAALERIRAEVEGEVSHGPNDGDGATDGE